MRFEKTAFEAREQKVNKSGRPGFKRKFIVTSLSFDSFDICAKPEENAKKNVKTASVSSNRVILFDGDDGFGDF